MTSISSRQRVLQNSYYFSSTRSSCLYCDCVSPKIHCKPSSLFIIFFSETSLEIRPLECFDARWLKRRGIMQGSGHGHKSRGDAGTSPPEFVMRGVGTLMQIVLSGFCHVSKFQAPDCLHYKHYNAVKSLPIP